MGAWETNCKILHEQYSGLLDEILRDEPDNGDLKIETAASGVPTLAIGGLYVHSPRDPEREGRRLAEASLEKAADGPSGEGAVVILGFGLGYTAQAVAELAPRRPVIIVEKKLSVIRKALELRDLGSLLSRPCVAFMPGGSGKGIINVLSFFEKHGSGKNGLRAAPCVIRNRTLIALDDHWYASLESSIRAWAMRDDINRATLNKFGKRWIRNLSRNMSAIRDLPGIVRLTGIAQTGAAWSGVDDKNNTAWRTENAVRQTKARGIYPEQRAAAHEDPAAQSTQLTQGTPAPVFLAAAGPGLDNIAGLLPQIHRRCIVVAVDTSLRFLQRNGIDPDFTLVVDPQFWNNRHLDRCTGAHTRLIVESAVYPPVLRLPFNEKYLCGSLFPLGAFIEQRVDPKGALGAGGSVATSAWDFSRILGARQIWIAGLDLAFPGLKTHFRGARFEEKALAESGRFNPAETWLVHALRDGLPFHAPSISGGQVLTDRRLSLYAAWFESSFRQFPAVRNYSIGGSGGGGPLDFMVTAAFSGPTPCCSNSTTLSPVRVPFSGGLAIAGLEPAEAQALLALPERREEIDLRLETVSARIKAEFFEPEEARRRAERYENAVTALYSGLRQIKNTCEKGEKIAAQALRRSSGPSEREKTFAALDEINRFITGSEVKEIAGFLFPPEAISPEMATLTLDETAPTADAFDRYLESSARLYRSLAESATLPANFT